MSYTTYGNEIWYKARNNSEKTAIVLHSDAVKNFTNILDDAGINYYGFNIEEKGIGKLTVLKNNLDFVKQLVGSEVAEKLRTTELKEYSPPEQNIFGTVSFKDIQEKAYLSCRTESEQEAALKTAQMLADNEIEFSGKVYPDRVTLTYEKDCEEPIVGIYNAVLKKQTVFRTALDNTESLFETELFKKGFSTEQVNLFLSQSSLKALEQLQVDEYDYISQLDERFTDAQNIEILKTLEAVAESGGFSIIAPSEAEKNLYSKKKEYTLDAEIRDFLAQHSFTEEQEAAIRSISKQEQSVLFTETIDETFSSEDIYDLYGIFSQAKLAEANLAEKPSVIIDKINNFLEVHRYNLRERNSVADFSAYMLDTLAHSSELRDVYKNDRENFEKTVSEYINSYVKRVEQNEAIFPGYTKADVENFVWEYNIHSNIRTKIQDSVAGDLMMVFSQVEQARTEYSDVQRISHDKQLGDIPYGIKKDTEEKSHKNTTSYNKTEKSPADKLNELTERLEQGIQDLFESNRYKEYLSVMSKFHRYSLNNTVLIAMQKPDATHIAGFNAWKNSFGRTVKKGERGIRIIAPSPYKIKKEMEKIDQKTQKPIIGQDGKPVTQEVEITIPTFKAVSVFDISQTEGKELPDIAVDELTGNVDRYKEFFSALEKISPVPIGFEKIDGSSHGYYHLVDKRIAIKEGMSELQTLKTAIHEISHAKLHDIDLNAPKNTLMKDLENNLDQHTREVQAESVAYVVCQHYGLDTSDYSFGYIAGWSSGKELAELKGSLETIRNTASGIINSIDGYFAQLQQNRETTMEISSGQEKSVSDKSALHNAQSKNKTAFSDRGQQPASSNIYKTEKTFSLSRNSLKRNADYVKEHSGSEHRQRVGKQLDI